MTATMHAKYAHMHRAVMGMHPPWPAPATTTRLMRLPAKHAWLPHSPTHLALACAPCLALPLLTLPPLVPATPPPHAQKQLAAERIGALLEDRRIREQEEELHRRSLTQQLETSADKLRKAEEQLRTTTKDYILGG